MNRKDTPGQPVVMSKAEAVGKGLMGLGCLIMLVIMALLIIGFVVLVIVA